MNFLSDNQKGLLKKLQLIYANNSIESINDDEKKVLSSFLEEIIKTENLSNILSYKEKLSLCSLFNKQSLVFHSNFSPKTKEECQQMFISIKEILEKDPSNIYTVSIYSSIMNINLWERLFDQIKILNMQQTMTSYNNNEINFDEIEHKIQTINDNNENYHKNNDLKINEIEQKIQTINDNNENYHKNNDLKINEIEQKINEINNKFENQLHDEIQNLKNNCSIEVRETANLDELERTGRYFINTFEGRPGYEYPVQTFAEKASFVEVFSGPNNTIHQTVYISDEHINNGVFERWKISNEWQKWSQISNGYISFDTSNAESTVKHMLRINNLLATIFSPTGFKAQSNFWKYVLPPQLCETQEGARPNLQFRTICREEKDINFDSGNAHEYYLNIHFANQQYQSFKWYGFTFNDNLSKLGWITLA